jgi:hypothetical protein
MGQRNKPPAEQRRIGSILTALKWKSIRDWKGRAYVKCD